MLCGLGRIKISLEDTQVAGWPPSLPHLISSNYAECGTSLQVRAHPVRLVSSVGH
jgi:hypothetical protein